MGRVMAAGHAVKRGPHPMDSLSLSPRTLAAALLAGLAMLVSPASAAAQEPTPTVEDTLLSSTVTGSGRPEAPVRFVGTRRAKTPPRFAKTPPRARRARSRIRAGVFGSVKRPARARVAI